MKLLEYIICVYFCLAAGDGMGDMKPSPVQTQGSGPCTPGRIGGGSGGGGGPDEHMPPSTLSEMAYNMHYQDSISHNAPLQVSSYMSVFEN